MSSVWHPKVRKVILTSIRMASGSSGRTSSSFFLFEDKNWSVPCPNYNPIRLTLNPSHIGKPYCDPEIGTAGFTPHFNQIDGGVDRRSHAGKYLVTPDGYPLCPAGRTGRCMRGSLGRWGPNHAADPIVTRWAKGQDGQGKVLLVVLIQRSDCGSWAFPGGMVDPGEDTKQTAMREFFEEAMDSLSLRKEDMQQLEQRFRPLYDSGVRVWDGVVESDGRNSDNSWMESVAYHFHNDAFDMSQERLKHGDDAMGVMWFAVDTNLRKVLCDSDVQMMQKAGQRLGVTI